MRVALNGWFTGTTVGSGQYADRLVASLRAGHHLAIEVIEGPPDRGAWSKLAFEQWGFPRAARRADVAHVPYWAPPLRPGCPTVVTVHDLIPLLLPEYRRRPAVRAYVELVARATPRAAAVLADSAHTARDITARLAVDPGRVHVVPLGVALPVVTDDNRAAIRSRHGLPDRFGLYLGGFDVRKNLTTLLAAWRAVHAATGVPLVAAGHLPGHQDPLAPHPTDVARVVGLPAAALRLIGPVAEADKPALYASAAVFAFPSRYEGFGLPPLEAMAAGCPVVAANATSLPEVIGEAGRLVPPDDVAAWSEAILGILGDEAVAARLGDAGRARAALFTWDRTARETVAVYEQVARR